MKQQTLKYHRNQQENIQGKHSGHSINNILTFPFTFIATIGHSIVDRQYLQLGHDQEAVNCPNEAFKQLYMPADLRTCCLVVGRSLDSGKILPDLRSARAHGDHKQQPQDMRGHRPGQRRVRLFTDFWRENLNFPALSLINRRGGGSGGGGEGEVS